MDVWCNVSHKKDYDHITTVMVYWSTFQIFSMSMIRFCWRSFFEVKFTHKRLVCKSDGRRTFLNYWKFSSKFWNISQTSKIPGHRFSESRPWSGYTSKFSGKFDININKSFFYKTFPIYFRLNIFFSYRSDERQDNRNITWKFMKAN